jgi:cytochrome c oxidase cbb3-type subunit 3/ubiquinol-cytochrome c reductase cytochrome c subunit
MKSKWLALALMLASMTFGIFATASAQGGDVSRGAKLFAQNCAVCHGDRAQGRVGATLAKDFPGIRVDALLRQIISNGVQGSVMPPWAKSNGGPLSDAEIDDLVAFIRSLGNLAPTVPPGPTATQPPLPSPVATFPAGDAGRGAKVFADNCAVCHGPNGEGRIGATLQKDFPGINVESFLDSTIARGVAGSRMPAWAKSSGGPLTDQDIADAAAFVRTLKKPGQPAPTQAPDLPQGGPFGGTLALICVGLAIGVGVVVLMIGLAGSRAQKG